MAPLCFSMSIFIFFLVSQAVGLNHGRNAKPGEFPFVVRVQISDLEDDARRIAAGIIITMTRVLTTCDTVGYFTGETVHLHMASRVMLMAGSIHQSGKGGQTLTPSSSMYHPWCHLLASEQVLFNLGFFIIAEPGFGQHHHIKPVKQTYSSKKEALEIFYELYLKKKDLPCVAAGWGYPTMAFEDKVEPDYFNSSSEILQMSDMTVIGFEGPGGCLDTTCREFGDCLVNIWEYGLFCAVAPKGGPCRNDRGAPLICDGVFVGMHTNPQRCEDRGIPRHFVRTDLVYDYIFQLKNDAILRSPNILTLVYAVISLRKLTSLRRIL